MIWLLKFVPKLEMVSRPVADGWYVHQMLRLPESDCSPGSVVAVALFSVSVGEVSVRTLALAKLSLAGAALALVDARNTTITKSAANLSGAIGFEKSE